MKLGIYSDLHIGKRMYRTDENNYNKFEHIGYRLLKQNVKALKNANPDLIINAGDVFDVSNPSIIAINKYYQSQASINNIPTMTILGNHDFSFNNKRNNCSAVEIIKPTYFADYELKTVEIDDCIFAMLPYIYDTKDNIKAIFRECYDTINNSTAKKKILVTHGVTEAYFKSNLINDPFIIPNKLIKIFDLVIIGHIHTPFDYMQDKTLVISPGGMIDYQADVDRTGPIILDTDTMKWERIPIKSPHIIKVNTTEANINDILSNVDENIYKITYDGDINNIDNDLFIQAKNKAVNLVIDVVSTSIETEENQVAELNLDIYSWINEHYKDYAEYFEKAKQDLTESN